MKNYKYVIVGGGISGLYTALILEKLNITDILVIEKSDRLGGRIHTIYDDINGEKYPIEMGAGRISSNHIHLINLIKYIGLYDKLSDGSKSNKFYYSNNIPNKLDENSDFYKIIFELMDKLNDEFFYELAKKYTLFQLIVRFYDIETARLIEDQFGYGDDIIYQNSIKALEMFNESFSPTNKFCSLRGGLKQIINEIVKKLRKTDIKISTTFINMTKNKNRNIYECNLINQKTNEYLNITSENIIFAIPVSDLYKIPYLLPLSNKFDCVINKPLMRVYMYFPLDNNNIVWFNDLNGAYITNSLIRQIIPIDKKIGLIMISYSDGGNALNLNNLGNLLVDEILYNLRKLFKDKQIPYPTHVHTKYWKTGTHIWTKYPSSELIDDMLCPMKDENIYMIGETFSPLHSWIEGAIITSNLLLQKLHGQDKI
jgi:protoporphyrinogen oxidase